MDDAIRLEDVIGGNGLRDELAAFVRAEKPRSVALDGPTGSGKSMLARAYVAALSCQAPTASGSACRLCAACQAIVAGAEFPGLEVLGPSRQQGPVVRNAIAALRAATWPLARNRILWVEDFDDLRGWRYVKEALDRPSPTITVVMTGEDRSNIPLPVQQRLEVFECARPSTLATFQVLSRIRVEQAIPATDEALMLIAEQAMNYREAVATLQRLSRQSGRLTAATMLRDASAQLLWFEDYLRALASQDIAGQLRAIEAATGLATAVAHPLRRVLVAMRLGEPGEAEHGARLCGYWRARLWRRLAEAAQTYGLSPQELWAILGDAVEGAPPSDVMALRLQAIRAFDQLRSSSRTEIRSAPTVAVRPDRPASLASGAPTQARSPDELHEHLSHDQALDIYEAATFALQVYWAPFNTLIELVWDEGAQHAPKGISGLIDRFAQGLQRAVERWSDVTFTRILINERDPEGRMVTSLVAHVPFAARPRLAAWLKKPRPYLSVREVLLPEEPTKVADEVRRHWLLVRRLWRGVDPSAYVDGAPLVDLLQVPETLLQPIGPGFTERCFSTSQAIGPGARDKLIKLGAPHASAMADRAWSWIDQGWERAEYLAWRRSGVNRIAELDAPKVSSGVSQTNRSLPVVEKETLKQYDRIRRAGLPWEWTGPDELDVNELMSELSPFAPR
jgi:hypothetical protein